MNAPTPTGMQGRARRLAATALIVAFTLWVAVSILESIAPVLITVAAISAAVYGGVLIARYRRSRW